MIRVAFYAHQVSEAVEMIEHCHELGYETTRQPDGGLEHRGSRDRHGAGRDRADARRR